MKIYEMQYNFHINNSLPEKALAKFQVSIILTKVAICKISKLGQEV